MSTYEKNISAQQKKKKEDTRFQNENENQERTQSIKPKTPERASRAHRLKFPKKIRLLCSKEFKAAKRGDRFIGKYLCVDICPAGKEARLGISASAKFGDAIERNRFKRLVREAFRLNHTLFPRADLHVVPRKHAKDATLDLITKELLELVFHGAQSRSEKSS